MLSIEKPNEENGATPEPETISMRWGLRLAAAICFGSLLVLLSAEYLRSQGIAEMQHTTTVASELARNFGIGILAILNVDRFKKKE